MFVCQDCFADEELRSEVVSNAKIEGVCDVCHTRGRVLEFSEFGPFFHALLLMFSPSDSGKTVGEIIQKEWNLFASRDIADRLLAEAMRLQNCGYAITSAVDYKAEIRDRVAIWDRLKTSVREKSRFFTSMDEFDQYNYLTAGYSLEKGARLYRSRITPAGQRKIKNDKMGCPPRELTPSGRANPVGIPYLYLSDSAKTTYYEVRAVYLDRLSVGTFEIERKQKLVDFIYDINLFLSYNDGNSPLEEFVIKKKVIEAISADLSKPLRRYDSELEYVPTQLICEYCKSIADGISFDSSLYKGGRNFVLFDSTVAKCKRVDIHEITSIDIDKGNRKNAIG